MTIIHNALVTDQQRRSGTITLSAILYGWFGFAFLVSSLLIGVYVLQNGRLPVVFGIDMLAGPFSERFGAYGAIIAALPWTVVNVLEMLAGRWLWRSRKSGGTLALVLFPIGLLFWLGYALPIMAVIGPLRVLLVARGWKSLR